MKNIRVVLEDQEYERLARLKGSKSWHDFIIMLADTYIKMQQENEFIPKDSLKTPYKIQAKALAELGKLMMTNDTEFLIGKEFYLAALLPLLVIGDEVNEKELIELHVLTTNLIFEYLKKRYKDGNKLMYLVMEYLRIAIIRELRGDTTTFYRFMREICKELGELP